MSEQQGKRLATIPEAAEYFNVPVRTMGLLVSEGRIPAVVLSERIRRVDIDAVEKAFTNGA